jgi:glyoxylase-like metal-dependent hydrolase (beta-lactamase superfamily II)
MTYECSSSSCVFFVKIIPSPYFIEVFPVNISRKLVELFLGLLLSTGWLVGGWAQAPDVATPVPLIAQDEMLKVSDHVYVILDNDVGFVPNVGIVVGERATLVIDTGLGLQNGEIVLGETNKVSNNDELYIASTHYHSEHDLGAEAFPSSAVMIRSRDQQQDLDEFRLSHAERFSSMSAVMAELLEGVDFRQADVYFDNQYTLDLGGVTVRMYAVGPAHTRGDTAFFVEEDGVLFSGDIAMRRYPRFSSPSSSARVWRESLKTLMEIDYFSDIEIVVPSHGPMGGDAVIRVYDEFFATLQSRVGELKNQGHSVDEVTGLLIRELESQYQDWPSEGAERIGDAARIVFNETP